VEHSGTPKFQPLTHLTTAMAMACHGPMAPVGIAAALVAPAPAARPSPSAAAPGTFSVPPGRR